MNTVTLTMALVMGLTGSLHCAGMCGPLIWIIPFQALNSWKKWLSISLYHLGRISVYSLMGLVMYSFKSLFQPVYQQYISIALGVIFLFIGLMSFVSGRFAVKLPWTKWVQQKLGRFIGNPKPAALLMAGMLNGLLPCGLVYMALSVSVGAATPLMSMAAMFAFGLGTVPMLVALTILKNKVTFHKLLHMRKLVPTVMIIFGCLFTVRGMNLGIPYLSPKVLVQHNEVKASCCHK